MLNVGLTAPFMGPELQKSWESESSSGHTRSPSLSALA